ncbi:hypothetical protein J8L98_03330 [Pseudoalteromonas sp. MMG013]|uniref:hypothetical protein n=1 Tax=Pseudoalteromonas sp. MMG013 TaxID=2822687 RepID=UPI001B36A8D9|nr:hypothetical protein [Pseudoalteromonas sp. MMG013]MBQ4860728.1 hypothetical protein [Pseudoalteromonas sp. MMG013]
MKLLVVTAMVISSVFISTNISASDQPKPQNLPQLLEYTNGAKLLIEQGAFDDALARLQWLDENATRISYDFYDLKRPLVYSLWWDLVALSASADIAYTRKSGNMAKQFMLSPQQCETFDTVLWLNQSQEHEQRTLGNLTTVHNNYNGSLERCWNGDAEYLAVKYINHALLERYSPDILSGFIQNIIVRVTNAYEACNMADEQQVCEEQVRDHLVETSILYQAVAMDRDDLPLAGRIGGETLKLLLQWQNSPL